jgi:adenine phosphoribosyltransferase
MTTINYQALIREVPDFPKPGILFYDITTLLKNPAALRSLADQMTIRYQDRGITKVVGIESRGFIFGGILATRLGAGIVMKSNIVLSMDRTVLPCTVTRSRSESLC